MQNDTAKSRMITWLTIQEKKVLLFVFSCLFVGILASWYFKLHPRTKIYPLSSEERSLIHREPVNINTADFNELIKIPGIGPVLAEAVLEYRKIYGPFKELNDLLQIKGIGKKKLEQINTYLILK